MVKGFFESPFAFSIGVALAICSFFIPFYTYWNEKNKLITEEPTCYGKVILQSWNSDTDKQAALQACSKIDAYNEGDE
jgi:hypothetical protein